MKKREMFEEIERKHGFKLPAEYVALAERGAFDFSGPAANYTDLVDDAYLWLHEMEWRPLAEVRDFQFQDYVEPGFVSFAFTGGGDDWCWHPPAASDGRVPVYFCPRDSELAQLFAPDFIGALYRQILAACVGGFGADDGEPDQRRYLARWSRELGPLLPTAAAQVLSSLATAPVQEFVTASEYAALLKRDLGLVLPDKELRWMKP